jgi:hypothetical protein
MGMMIKNSLMILVLLAFVGCAKEKPTFNALDKFFDCLGDSSKCEKLKNSVEE